MSEPEVAPKVDHVAILVDDIDHRIETLLATGAFKLLREGTQITTGNRIVMMGDGTGFKIELIQAPGQATTFAHVALRVPDVDGALASLPQSGWEHKRGPNELQAARARTGLLCDGDFDLQVIAYESDSPDMVVWD